MGPGKGYVDVSTVDADTAAQVRRARRRAAAGSQPLLPAVYTPVLLASMLSSAHNFFCFLGGNNPQRWSHCPPRPLQVAAAVRAKGASFLEAPVSGSKGPAEQGQLIFLTAGAWVQRRHGPGCFWQAACDRGAKKGVACAECAAARAWREPRPAPAARPRPAHGNSLRRLLLAIQRCGCC